MSASLRVMARPSPVPPNFCAVVLSAWPNSLNRLACCSAVHKAGEVKLAARNVSNGRSFVEFAVSDDDFRLQTRLQALAKRESFRARQLESDWFRDQH
jgi:hypothetical protein